jgi:phytoene dehydrogenase-like protein
LRDAYAERVIAQLRPHILNISSAQIGIRALGPQDLAAMNVNLVGGDPYAGDCRVDQYAAWRPLSTATGHGTGIDGLWHIGASTHPGPGLGGGSGYLVAQRLLTSRWPKRR